jgi:hypothetical protein
MKGKDYVGDLVVDGRIILRYDSGFDTYTTSWCGRETNWLL